MTNETQTGKLIRKTYNFPERMCVLLDQAADDLHTTRTEIIEKATSSFLTEHFMERQAEKLGVGKDKA